MKSHVIPEVQEPQFKKKARVSKTASNLTKTSIQVEMTDPTKATAEGNVNEFLRQAMLRFNMAADSDFYNRTEGLKDVQMVDGEGQWDDNIRGKRVNKKRPVITINRFIPMIAHVANEERMSRPAIQVDPVSGGADPVSAKIRLGLIRHIENESDAETIYDTAFERMIEKGWSWYRVVTDWESETSFNQVILIEGFTNDFSVYCDPTAEDPTRKDMKWAFIVYDMPRGEYTEQYPKSKAAGLTNWSSVGDWAPQWVTADSIRVAEYYYMRPEKLNTIRIAGGDGVWEDEIEQSDGLWYMKAQLRAMEAGALEPEQVLPVTIWPDDNGELVKRESVRWKPMWAKINAVEILDGDKGDDPTQNTAGRRIPGKYIPLIMLTGREHYVNGVRRLSGMVRANRDAQRVYNYMVSGFVEMVALAPKSPFIAAIGQIEDFKPLWDKLNEENYSYLPYKPRDVAGQQVPPPQRTDQNPPITGYLAGINQFDNILKLGFNIFDPSLGTAKSDQSGRAIAGLQARSDSANMNWMDNARRSHEHCGQVILEMIPEVYDAARTITAVRPDNKREAIQINQEFQEPDGTTKTHDMSVGRFSCTVSLGQHASKRQQSVQDLTGIVKAYPAAGPALLPLIVDQMDSPMAAEASAILKRMQPPQLQEPGSPEAQQAQFQALLQQHQQLVTAMNRVNQILETKQLDNATKQYVAGLQAQAQIVSAALKAGSGQAVDQARMEFERITQLLDQFHEQNQLQQESAHEVRLELLSQQAPETAGATA